MPAPITPITSTTITTATISNALSQPGMMFLQSQTETTDSHGLTQIEKPYSRSVHCLIRANLCSSVANFSSLQMLIKPTQHRVVPEVRIRGLLYPVAFIGKVHQF